jgi:sugar lactone lactonase YvrE
VPAGNRVKRGLAAAAVALLASLCWSATASALAPCPNQPQVNVISDGHTALESIGIDRRGRLFFTDSGAGQLLMLKSPAAEPKVIAEDIDGPGGIVFQRQKGNVLVGFGDSIAQATDGTLNPEAGLLRVNPKSGKTEIRTEGLQMANGIARGPEHSIFASNDISPGGIDRVQQGRMPELNWGTVLSPNGMVSDSSRDSLFVNQTFTASAIQRVPFDDPGAAAPYFQAPAADAAGGLDGLARGDGNTLFAAANGAGAIWQVDGPGDGCRLAALEPFPAGPSDLAFGRPGTNFSPDNLYVTTFGGELLELVGARG